MATPNQGSTPRSPSAYTVRAGEDHLRRLSGLEANPEIQSLMRKLIPDIEGNSTQSKTLGNGRVDVPDPAYLQQIAGSIGQSTTDATSLLQLLPDLTLVMNLLTSAILAPKDLASSEVTFKVDRRAFRLPCSARMLDVIIDHFTNVYNIKAILPDALKDIIFRTGSYPMMVVPENSVDAMINGSMGYSTENYSTAIKPLLDSDGEYRSFGILGPGPNNNTIKSEGNVITIESASYAPLYESALESLHAGTRPPGRPETCYAKSLEAMAGRLSQITGAEFAKTVVISDNFNVIKTGPLMEAKRRTAVENAISLEAGLSNYYGGGGGYANYALGGAQRQRTTFSRASVVQAIKTNEMLSKPMVGHPLVMRIPSESVIPVFIQPDKHLGYFVLLDADGNPLKLANRKDIYNDLSTSNNGTGSSTQGASQMIQMTQNLSIGVNPRENPRDPAQMVRIYGQLLEHELKTRLANGVYGPNAKIDVSGEVYQIMLARSMKRQQTQILYVPGELMVYMAFDYAENGTGRSITEQTKIIGSMRAMLGFSNVMAGIKNSVSRQKVTLVISENDPDPGKTIARTMDEYTRRRNVTMPFVASDPADMISYINMAGVEFNVEGKGIPQHKVDIEDKQTNRAKVDVELDNMLRDRHYMAYGVTPEAVTSSMSADFAISVATNNQMFAKRVITFQDQFTPFLEQLVRMISANSAVIMNLLREVVLSSVQDLKKAMDSNGDLQGRETVDRTKAQLTTKKPNPADLIMKSPDRFNTESVDQQIFVEYPDPAQQGPQRILSPEESRLVDQVVFQFLDAVRVSLPRPDTATEEMQIKAVEQHADMLDKTIPYVLDAAFLGQSNLGEFAGHIEEIKAALKSLMMRQWMANNGIGTEVLAITALDEDGNPELDLQSALNEHVNGVATFLKNYLIGIGKERELIRGQAAELTKQFPDAGLTGDGVGGTAGGAGGAGGGDFGGGGGDFGGGYGGDMGGGAPDEGGFGADSFGGGPVTGAEEPAPGGLDEGASSAQQKAQDKILGKPPAIQLDDEEEEEDEDKDQAGGI